MYKLSLITIFCFFYKFCEIFFIFPAGKETVSEESPEAANLVLPPEILLKIFTHLEPREVCRCAQVCKDWSSVAMDPGVWAILHPSRWGRGDFTFGRNISSDDCNCDCEPNYNLLQFRE